MTVIVFSGGGETATSDGCGCNELADLLRKYLPSALVIRKAYYDPFEIINDSTVILIGFSFGGEAALNWASKIDATKTDVFVGVLDGVMQTQWFNPFRPPFRVPLGIVQCRSWRREALAPPYSSGLNRIDAFSTEVSLSFFDAHNDVPRDAKVRQDIVDWCVTLANYESNVK